MELYTRIFDNNLCIAHFSFTYEEAMHIYQEVEKYIDDNLDIEEHFIKAIEIKYINEALEEKELVCVGEKEIRILSDLRENQPYVLVARFLVLPEVVNLSLPINIPYSLKCDVNKKINNVSYFFKVKLLSNDLAQLQDVDVIDLDCIVRYDLRFIIDGEIISVYDNQILEMYKDVELQPERFVGARINDAVAISDVEGVVTDFLIRKIQKKIPYNETTDKSIFIDLGYNDYFDLLDKFKKSFERVTRVESYIDYIVDFIYENTKLEYSKEINNFYKELDYFAYDKEYHLAKDDCEREKAIHKSYIFDLLAKMVELKDPILLDNEIDIIIDEYKNYRLKDNFDYYDIKIYSIKNRIYRYLDDEGIIN